MATTLARLSARRRRAVKAFRPGVACVAWLVARGTLRSVAIGIALGALVLTVVRDGVRRFLYETSTGDPVNSLTFSVWVSKFCTRTGTPRRAVNGTVHDMPVRRTVPR